MPRRTSDKTEANLTTRVRYEDPPIAVASANWAFTDDTLRAVKLVPAARPSSRADSTNSPTPRAIRWWLASASPRCATSPRSCIAVRSTARASRTRWRATFRVVYTFCVSQPCRTMHDYLWLGFNQDDGRAARLRRDPELGRRRRRHLHELPLRPAGRTHRQHIARWYPEYQFPFANQLMTDPVTGKTDGRLRRCLEAAPARGSSRSNSENEYWAKAMSVFQLDGEATTSPIRPTRATTSCRACRTGRPRAPPHDRARHPRRDTAPHEHLERVGEVARIGRGRSGGDHVEGIADHVGERAASSTVAGRRRARAGRP